MENKTEYYIAFSVDILSDFRQFFFQKKYSILYFYNFGDEKHILTQ